MTDGLNEPVTLGFYAQHSRWQNSVSLSFSSGLILHLFPTKVISFSMRLFRFSNLAVCLLVALPLFLFAQISEPRPVPSIQYQLPNLTKGWVAPPLDMAAIRAEDAVNDLQNEPLRFAFPFAVALGFKSGQWIEFPNGDRVWRLRISAPGAQAITLLYDRFYLPPGATLHLRNPKSNEVLGAFTSKNNNEVRRFATAAMLGDVTELEYYEPAAQRGQGDLQVAQVGHAYRLMDTMKGLNDSGPCQVNINCPEGAAWQNEKRGVARFFINGIATCSGTLVNNTAEDGTPYFLTADHCIDGMDALGNIDGSGFLFYWNYERSGCANSGSVPINTTSGATLVANNSATDFALFRLTESPNGSYNPYFNGWSAEADPGVGGVGIHHPALDAKKIATHNTIPNGNSEPNYWRLFWQATPNGHSVTEGGSSGSGLWNSDHRLIGQLFGGSSINCDDPANDLGRYGKIAASWESNGATEPGRRLRDWLDPLNTGTRVLDGSDIAATNPTVGFLNTPPSVVLTIAEGAAASPLDNDCRGFTDYAVLVGASFALSGQYEVNVNASGTAQQGLDYEILNPAIFLSSTLQETFVELRIFDDASADTDKTLILTLTGSGGAATIGVFDEVTITLTDNDQRIAATTVQEIFAEDFESGLGAWTIDNGGTTVQTWTTTSAFGGASLNGSNFLFYDSDGPGNGRTSDETITSPVINTAGISDLTLRFDQFFRTYDEGGFEEIFVEVFDGTAWELVYYRNQDDGDIGSWASPDRAELDVSAFANANFRIRFRFLAGWDWWWAIDNVSISGQVATQVADVVMPAALEVYLGPFSTVPIRDPQTGKVVAEITNLSSFDHACTSVLLDRVRDAQAVYPLYDEDISRGVMARSLYIEPENIGPNPNYQLRLFVEPEDIATWQAATNENTSSGGLFVLPGTTVPSTNPTNFFSTNASWTPTSQGLLNTINYFEADLTAFGGIAFGLDAFTVPVTWSAFTGKVMSDQLNRLDWSTAQEFNNERFIVEHATANASFAALGEVVPNDAGIYTFDHLAPPAGLNLYRIKQIDFDGAYSYSSVINLTNTIRDLGRVLVSPVVDRALSMTVSSTVHTVELIDAAGRLLLLHQAMPTGGGTFSVPLPTGIPAGLLLVRFISDKDSHIQRVIVR